MEIELKYSIPDKKTAEMIWEDAYLKSMEEPETREKLCMKAVYFDTSDYDLVGNEMAYRVREEGKKIIASLKWSGKSEGALHTREEINVPVSDRGYLERPNPAIFEESKEGRTLIDTLEGKTLHKIMKVDYYRRRFRVDTGSCLAEVSIDQGEIKTDNGSEPICEVEVELFSGEQEDLVEIGKKLQEKYDITTEKRSKFYRGLILMGKV